MEWWTKSYLILRLLGHRPNRATGANRANRANGANKPDGANGPNRATGATGATKLELRVES